MDIQHSKKYTCAQIQLCTFNTSDVICSIIQVRNKNSKCYFELFNYMNGCKCIENSLKFAYEIDFFVCEKC